MSHLLGTISRQVCKKTSQISEMSFFMIHMLVSCLKVIALSLHFLAKYVANLAKKLAKWLNLNFFNDFLCWLVVQILLRIELFNGPFVRTLFSPSMPKNEPNVRNVFFLWFICWSVVWKTLRYLSIFSPNMSPILPKKRAKWLNVIFLMIFYAGWLFVSNCV